MLRLHRTHTRLIFLNRYVSLICRDFRLSWCLLIGARKLNKLLTLKVFILIFILNNRDYSLLVVYQYDFILENGLFGWADKVLLNWTRISTLLRESWSLHVGEFRILHFISNRLNSLFLLIGRKFLIAW